VLDTLNTFATEVQTEAGKWYNMRILPYRTVDNVIDGLVLTFAEITRQKETETTLQHLNDALREARDVNRNIIDTLREGLLILDGGLRIESANRSFYRLFRLGPAQVNGQRLFELADACWDIPALRQALAGVIETDEAFENLTITQTFAEIGQHTLRLSGRQLVQQTGQVLKILLMIEDFTSPS
jgi:two-component system CheB/CheR fusion protein